MIPKILELINYLVGPTLHLDLSRDTLARCTLTIYNLRICDIAIRGHAK